MVTLSKTNRSSNLQQLFVSFYIIQEFCIADLSFFNLHIVYFMYVIPITMILRNRNRMRWELLAITPILVVSTNYYFHLYQFINLQTSLIQVISIFVICIIFVKVKRLSYYIKYAIALYFNSLINFLCLHMDGISTTNCGILGLFPFLSW